MTSPVVRASFFAALAALACGCNSAALRQAADAIDALEDGVGEAARPLPASGAASDDPAREQRWFDRNLVEAYRRLGRDRPGCGESGETFIAASAPFWLGLTPAASVDLVVRARSLLDAGCDDPVVAYFAARALASAQPDAREASEVMERALAGMRRTRYSRGSARFVASGFLRDLIARKEGTGKRDAIEPLELAWFLESLSDGSYEPDEDVVVSAHLLSGSGESMFERNREQIVAALRETAWVDEWVRALFAGEGRLEDAWNARGGHYSSEVTTQGWQGFEESLEQARRDLTRSWELRPDRPEAATGMITVAMAASRGDTPRLWFDRAVAARFDYMPAYARLIHASRRRWSGPPDALQALARECAATRRFDTDVPFVAFEAIEQQESDLREEAGEDDATEVLDAALSDPPPSAYEDPEVFDLVWTVLERYRRESARGRQWQRYASLQAAVAYKAHRYAEARQAVQDLGGELTDEARRAAGGDFVEARIHALAVEEISDDTLRAEQFYQQNQGAAALPLFEKARAGAPQAAAVYLNHRLSVARLEAELNEGRWARFLPPSDLAGWQAESGTWTLEPDGSLLGASGSRGLLIRSDVRLGPDFEVEADIEIAATSNGQFQAGIVFGEQPSFWTRRWTSFRLKRTAFEGEVVYFSKHFNRPNQSLDRPVPLRNRVVLQSWRGKLWAWIDGESVFSAYTPEWARPSSPRDQLGFGSYIDDNTFSVRYRDVRVRRLSEPPGAPRPALARDP